MAVNKKCHLLELPAELRSRIYNFCFDPAARPKKVNLLEDAPPAKDVLLTCRRIYNEAAATHRHAYRAYWTCNIFFLNLEAPKSTNHHTAPERLRSVQLRQYLKHISAEGLAHVKTLRAVAETRHECWAYDDGIWSLWNAKRPHPVTCMRRTFQTIWILEEDVLSESGTVSLAMWSPMACHGWLSYTFNQRAVHLHGVERAKQIYMSRRGGLSVEELLCCLVV